MNKGKAQRLQERRHQGPSMHEKCRGPNTGAWENTFFPIRRDQGQKTGISDGNSFRSIHVRDYKQGQ